MPVVVVACGIAPLLFAVVACHAADAAGPGMPTASLDAAVQATWTSVPLHDWTSRMATLAGKPVILDRRLDPDLPVTRTAQGEPLREVLQAVAAACGAAVDELPGSIRIVPASAAARAVQADADRQRRLAALTARQRKLLAEAKAWRWPAGASPRDLVASALGEAGLTVDGLDAIPHDHFPAADLPPLSLAERLDLVLAHFDRRILWTGGRDRPAGRLVAIDAEISAGAASPRNGAAARTDAPRRSSDPPRRSVTVREEFTLRLEAPLDQALAAIAARLGLELDLDRESLTSRGIAPGEIVRADVEKASRDGLLDAVLQPVGLRWKIDGQRLRVFAAERTQPP